MGLLADCLFTHDESVEIFGELLGEDGSGDERDLIDGFSDVSHAVDDFVCWCNVRCLCADEAADFLDDFLELFEGELLLESGNRFEFIGGTACVSEPSAGDHRYFHTEFHHKRYEDDGGLIAYPTRGVLVNLSSRDVTVVHHLPGVCHCLREESTFFDCHAFEVDSH